jgi:hypothetical protein
MLSRLRQVVTLALLIALSGLGATAQAQTTQSAQTERTRREELRFVVTRIDNRMASFRKSLDASPDRSKWNGTRAEDRIDQLIKDFEIALNELRSALSDRTQRQYTRDEAQDLLRRALLIDNFMFNRRVSGDALKDWMNVRTEIDRLAQGYNIATARWNVGTVPVQDNRDVRQLITRIETTTNSFRSSLQDALNNTRIDGTRREDNINQLVQEFEDATDRLRDHYNGRVSDNNAEAQEVLQRAARINRFMTRYNLSGRAASDWQSLRTDLDQLALVFNVPSQWNVGDGGYTGGGGGGGYNDRANRLTGTFRLDRAQSDDARRAADQATRDLPSNDRQWVYDRLVTRLESPDQIAIERNGRNVTIASTRSPQITFEADGREQVEETQSGRTIRTVATLNGDQLSVTTTGNRDTDFNVTFDPIEGGRRLRVVRRLSSDRLNRTVEVQSVYDRTSDVAQWNVYTGSSNYPTTGSVTGEFIVPNGTQVVAVLNTNLNTRDLRDGDRFTMTVRSPRDYDGGIIEGYVSNIDRGGRISGRSEMTLNFERIRNPRDNRTYNFAGIVQSVRTLSGDVVNVNNEGNVREDSRTSTTVKRAAIGTAVGALIGAIAGGGKGAAIGAAVGAGAGAGSVYVQGRDDVNLQSGTEVTILATGPR